jgi:hypothetical protein
MQIHTFITTVLSARMYLQYTESIKKGPRNDMGAPLCDKRLQQTSE